MRGLVVGVRVPMMRQMMMKMATRSVWHFASWLTFSRTFALDNRARFSAKKILDAIFISISAFFRARHIRMVNWSLYFGTIFPSICPFIGKRAKLDSILGSKPNYETCSLPCFRNGKWNERKKEGQGGNCGALKCILCSSRKVASRLGHRREFWAPTLFHILLSILKGHHTKIGSKNGRTNQSLSANLLCMSKSLSFPLRYIPVSLSEFCRV